MTYCAVPMAVPFPLKVRSVTGLMPLAAATVIPASIRTEFPGRVDRAVAFLYRHPAVTEALFGKGRQIREPGPVLFELFDEERLRRILARMLDEDEFFGPHGIRSVSRYPVQGGQPMLQNDPHWRDLLLFYEYFTGDNGAGIGASHQTGWTGTVAMLPLLARRFTASDVVAGGMGRIVGSATPSRPAVG